MEGSDHSEVIDAADIQDASGFEDAVEAIEVSPSSGASGNSKVDVAEFATSASGQRDEGAIAPVLLPSAEPKVVEQEKAEWEADLERFSADAADGSPADPQAPGGKPPKPQVTLDPKLPRCAACDRERPTDLQGRFRPCPCGCLFIRKT